MNVRKGIFISIAVTLTLALVVPVAYLGQIISSTVERTGTRTLGVRTRVGGVALGLLSGRVGVSDVQIANPEGFERSPMLQIGDARLAVDLMSLRRSTVEVPELTVGDVELHLELMGTRTNVGQVLDRLRSRSAASRPSARERASPGKRFVVRDLRIENVAAQVRLSPGIGDASTATIVVPEIKLSNVGSRQGVPLAQLTEILVASLLDAVARSDTGLPDEIAKQLDLDLAGLPVTRGEIIGAVRTAVDEAGVEADETIEERARGAIEKVLGDRSGG